MNIISTPRAPAAIGPYSQAIREGRFVYTSGQIPLHPETGQLIQETFAKEVKQVLHNLREILSAAGTESTRGNNSRGNPRNVRTLSSFCNAYARDNRTPCP
jgi:2-iminobutanoate/2-iminopropanoate deaminase